MQLSGRYSASSLLDEILKPISEAEPETNRMHAAAVVFIQFSSISWLERAEATTARRKPSKLSHAIAIAFLAGGQAHHHHQMLVDLAIRVIDLYTLIYNI